MKKAERITKIIFGTLIFGLSLFLKFSVTKPARTIWGQLFASFTSGDILNYWTKDLGVGGIPLLAAFCLMAIALLLYLLSAVLALKNKSDARVEFLKRFLMYFFFIGVAFNQYSLIIYGLMLIDFILSKYFEADLPPVDTEKQAAEKKRKQDLAFPGKYPRLLHQIIWENVCYTFKESLIMVLGCFIAAFSLLILTSSYYPEISHQSVDAIFEQNSIATTIIESGGLLLVLSGVLLYVVFSNHIPVIKEKSEIFLLLGARKKLFYRICLEDYFYGIFGGGFLGLICSSLILLLNGNFNFFGILLAVILYLATALLALLVNLEKIRWLLYSWDPDPRPVEVQAPRFNKWLLASGFVFLIFGFYLFADPKSGERLVLLLLTFIGLYLVLRGSIGSFLHWQQGKKDYFKHLLTQNTYSHDFVFNLNSLFILSCLAVSIFGFFAVNLISQTLIPKTKDLFPYDVLAVIYDADLEKVSQIKEKYQVKETQYPMIRVTSVDGDKALEPWGVARPVTMIQGQNIGISEGTYQALRKQRGLKTNPLNLEGKEIQIVHQQDPSVKTQPIDWDQGSKRPRLRIGQPLLSYNTANVDLVFPEYQVKGEEKTILIGEVLLGTQENLVVFSNQTFQQFHQAITEKNQKNWQKQMTIPRDEWRNYSGMHDENLTEGPTNLLLWQVPKQKDLPKIAQDLAYLKEKYKLEQNWDVAVQPFYLKSVSSQKVLLQEKLTHSLTILMLIILDCLSLFFFYARFIVQSKKIETEQFFLRDIGMRTKARKKLITSQLLVYTILPNSVGLILGSLYLVITLKNRFYTMNEVSAFTQHYGLFLLGHVLLWILAYVLLKKELLKKVGLGGVQG